MAREASASDGGSGAREPAAASGGARVPSAQNADTLDVSAARSTRVEERPEVEERGSADLYGDTLAADVTSAGAGAGDPAADSPRAHFGRYVIIERVGAGGMGEVYAAYDPELDRKVAIKLIRPGRAGPDARARLLREAQAMARLSHPNVVAVHDVGTLDDQVFVAMEFVRGETLGQWQSRVSRSWREIRDMFVQAGKGLAAAHAAGLVHRDFKPENVLVDREQRARVTDFGLARAAEDEATSPAPSESLADMRESGALSSRLTHVGALLGTPGYMAPEQWEGQPADARSDQYAFCVSLYEALYAEAPFRGKNLAMLHHAVVDRPDPEPPRGRGVPGWLRRLALRRLRRAPEERWESMEALLRKLARDRGGRRLALVGVTAVAAAVIASRVAGGDDEACADAHAQLEEVWGPSPRGAVDAALRGSGVAYAGETADRVTARLDAYADGWIKTRAEACHAYRGGDVSSDMYDREIRCLERRRAGLAALVAVLRDADAPITERAVQAADALPGLRDCTDPTVLSLALKPPEDPEAARAVARLRDLLARAQVDGSAGRARDGLKRADEALTGARALGYRPLIAEALTRVGLLQTELARFEDARDSLLDGWSEGLASQHDDEAARAAAQLIHVVGYRLARTEDGLLWTRNARAMIERRARRDRVHASYLESLGSLRARLGSYDEAAAALEEAVAILEAELGPEHTEVARVLASLGDVVSRAGEPARALELLTRALELQERALGPGHPGSR
ncbi:MAG: serine/threonine protein kinase [Myxococcales bacterium]|nr:serine/threonine protein kinase [Myxococcales bacterium]